MRSTPSMPDSDARYPDLFNRALTELNVDRMARDAGVKGLPPPDSTELDTNERQIITYFSNELCEQRKQRELALSRQALDRAATSSKIEINQTRASLSGLFNAIEPDLARQQQDHGQDLEIAKDQEAKSLRYLRHFRQEHGLQNRAADPHQDPLWHFSLVAAFAVLEWIALSIFYAEGSDFGLLGGIVMAMALSIINIGLAVFVGAIFRYVNHKSLRRKILAFLGVALLILLFLFATGFAAHYRTAARDLVASGGQPTAIVSQAIPGQAGNTTRPMTGAEDDQWKASKLAWEQFLEHGFIFTDVLSWLLVILATMFGIVASWKSYGIDDRYPGYGPTSRRYEEHKAAYEAKKKQYTEAVDSIFLRVGENQRALLHNIRRDIAYFQELVSKSESEVNQYLQFVQQVEKICSNVVFHYREVNQNVAVRTPPAYFENPVSIDSALLKPLMALTEEEHSLLKEYAAVILEFTKLVEEGDKKRQALRTDHLGKLHDFFVGIELAINDTSTCRAQPQRAWQDDAY